MVDDAVASLPPLEPWFCDSVAVTASTVAVGAVVWLWVIVCAAEDDVTGCTRLCTLRLGIAWLRLPPTCNLWAGCEVTAEGLAVEDDRPASILYASLGTAHCTTIPVEPEAFGSA